jgi:hypothetical protein
MKKFLMISGVVFWVLFVVGAFFLIRGLSLDASSKTFVDKVIPNIISTWSEQELLKHSSVALKTVVSDPHKQAYFDQIWTGYIKLGALKKYEGSNGQSLQSGHFLTGKNDPKTFNVTAEYVADADFQNGSAQIKIQLVYENSEWKINQFSVE